MEYGRAARIREFIASNPGATSTQVAKATGICLKVIYRALWRMVASGKLIVDASALPQHYFIAGTKRPRKKRAPKPKPSAGEIRAISSTTTQGKPAPAGERESVEEFLARGGKVDRLSCSWDNASPISRLHAFDALHYREPISPTTYRPQHRTPKHA